MYAHLYLWRKTRMVTGRWWMMPPRIISQPSAERHAIENHKPSTETNRLPIMSRTSANMCRLYTHVRLTSLHLNRSGGSCGGCVILKNSTKIVVGATRQSSLSLSLRATDNTIHRWTMDPKMRVNHFRQEMSVKRRDRLAPIAGSHSLPLTQSLSMLNRQPRVKQL